MYVPDALPQNPLLEPQDAPRILKSRDTYRSCHIVLPETGERMPAIAINANYYSFFRTEKEEVRAYSLYNKLLERGHTPIITRTPKGFAVWILEPDAHPAGFQKTEKKKASRSTYRILTSPQDIETCQIRVPDLDKQLSAMRYEGKFYSLFKTVDDIQQATQLIKRLSYQGDETIIIQSAEGLSLWILEPDARLATD